MINETPLIHSLIASVLYQPSLIHNVALPDDAIQGIPGAVWREMRELALSDTPLSSLAIEDALQRRGLTDLTAYRNYLRTLGGIAIDANLDHCVAAILDVYERRQAQLSAERLMQAAHSTQADIQQAKAEIAGALLRGFSTQNTTAIGELLEPDIAEVMEWAESPLNTGEVRGIRSGLSNLDNLIDGLWPGLFVIAGRTSMGKTALAIRIARVVAESSPVLYCTFENSAMIIRRRMICAAAGVPYTSVKSGLSDTDLRRYIQTSEAISRLPITFYSGERGLAYVTAAINQEYHRRGDLGMVVLDNLGHIKTGEDKYEERGTVCKAMNALTSRLGFTALALNQINRQPESRAEKRPTMGDLSDSGQIEQDADLIGLLYRDGYYNPDSPDANIIELAIAKNRLDGSTGVVRLFSHKRSGEISDAVSLGGA